MKFCISIRTFLLAIGILGLSNLARAEDASKRRHAVYGELGGRGLLYSAGYDFSVHPRFAVGAGITYFSVDLIFIDLEKVVGIPLYLNFYPLTGRNRILLTAGAAPFWGRVKAGSLFDELFGKNVTAGTSSRFSILTGQVGVGYELRLRFLLRVVFYGIFTADDFVPYFGASFGGTF